MNKLIYLYLLLLATGCAQPGYKAPQPGNAPAGDVATTPPCGNYLHDYKNDLRFDTVLHGRGGAVRVYAFADTTQKVLLPPELRPDCAAPFFYETCIKVTNASGKTFTINRDLVGFIITSGSQYVPRYTVPLGISIDSFNTQTTQLNIRFSLSVPFTDLGTPLKMNINTTQALTKTTQTNPPPWTVATD